MVTDCLAEHAEQYGALSSSQEGFNKGERHNQAAAEHHERDVRCKNMPQQPIPTLC